MHRIEDHAVKPAPLERKLGTAAVLPAILAVLLWCAYWLDQGLHLDLYRFGVYPRSGHGLVGIVASPFIHGDMEHVLNNSIPVLVLGTALMYFFPQLAGRVVLASWVGSGVGVWLTARASFHIGASGMVYGLAAFLFMSGVLRRQRMLMGLSLLVVFLYGGLLWGIVPIFPRISWESHFWGAAIGVAMAYFHRREPTPVHDPREVVWEEDEEEEEAVPSSEGAGPEPPIWRTTTTWDQPPPEKSGSDPTPS